MMEKAYAMDEHAPSEVRVKVEKVKNRLNTSYQRGRCPTWIPSPKISIAQKDLL